MAAPNIVNVSTITGISTAITLSSGAASVIVSNAAASNKVLKINTLMAANIDGVNARDITVRYCSAAAGAGATIPLTFTVNVPPDASLVVIGKDNPIYLEENRSIIAQSTVANVIAVICSYEEIS